MKDISKFKASIIIKIYIAKEGFSETSRKYYRDTSYMYRINCMKIIDTYNTSWGMYHIVRVIITKSSYNQK